MPGGRPRTHYELLGVPPTCTFEELRTAYRRRARECHPDVVGEAGSRKTTNRTMTMAEVNEAWRVLSDTKLRRLYDATVVLDVPSPTPVSAPQPVGSRRQAWAAGVQAQMARLARQAGRSATQTLLIRNPRAPRSAYEAVVDDLVHSLSREPESRVRSARASGAAPLDLGVAATLVGIRTEADRMRRNAPLGVTAEAMMAAELLDRMWDVLAHELPVQLTAALGGNPQVARALTRAG